jgi:rhodanese-related sulfurtransferase
MGAPTGESSCAKETPGTVVPCKLHVSALGAEQPGGAHAILRQDSTPIAAEEKGYSEISAADLVKQGYANVRSLKGGMSAWQQAGFTIDR